MEKNQYHFFFAIALATSFLLFSFIFVEIKTQGDSSTSSATVVNATPTIDTIFITTSSIATTQDNITLTENTTTNVFIKGTYSDNNGCDEVTTSSGGFAGMNVALYRSGISGGTNCSANNADCYPSISCHFFNCTTGGLDTTGSFLCTSTMQYYADRTDSGSYSAQTWMATATTTDKFNASAVSSTGGVEMNSLLALGLGENGFGDSISYGELAVGATSLQDDILIIRNTGNVQINPEVSGTDLVCSVRTVDVSRQKYATSSGLNYAQKISLSTTPAPLNICMGVASQSASSTTSTFWMIRLPTTSVAGSCEGTTTVNAASC